MAAVLGLTVLLLVLPVWAAEAAGAAAAAQAAGAAADELSAGRDLMASGRFVEAAQALERAERQFAEARDHEQRLRALQALAESRQALGDHERAIAALHSAMTLAESSKDELRLARVKAQLGGIHLQAGREDLARPLLVAALEAARAGRNRALAAAVLNDLGTLHRLANDRAAARDAYGEGRRLAQETDDRTLSLRVLLNAGSLELESRDPGKARELAMAAQQVAKGLEAQPYLRAQGLIWSGLILSEIARVDPASRSEAGRAAHAVLLDARHVADTLKDPRLKSAASGALGGLYLQAERGKEALTLTQEAIFEAQSVGAAELLFRWQWQAARIHRAQSDLDRAIASFRHALAAYEASSLAPATTELGLPSSEPSHRVYLEFADVLLQRAGTLETGAAQPYLVEARDAVEKLKARELQDYFRDSCVAEARVRVKGLVQSLGTGTAVLYPIVLPDRLELLLNLGVAIKRYTVPQKEAAVLEAAREFRDTVESQRTRAYLPPAQTLYRWLIAPLEADLAAAQVTTLVSVPDHALRAIPMAALHDGERFLVERLAVVMAPGLELTDPRPLPSRSAKSLLTGLTESVQGFPALRHVETELANIRSQFAGRTLKNEAFVRNELEQALTRERYNIAHIASHGEFSGDVRASFVLAYDGKISVDELARFIGFNRFRDDPLDLLTLSACQTAAGDERAALGLAGITVKAGARSALASLWPIHDEATSLLMSEFYRQLHEAGAGKALALQRAQQKLAAVTRYRHPGYWSGFVLIGNWL
jgi:CHAT domain-containing protein